MWYSFVFFFFFFEFNQLICFSDRSAFAPEESPTSPSLLRPSPTSHCPPAPTIPKALPLYGTQSEALQVLFANVIWWEQSACAMKRTRKGNRTNTEYQSPSDAGIGSEETPPHIHPMPCPILLSSFSLWNVFSFSEQSEPPTPWVPGP